MAAGARQVLLLMFWMFVWCEAEEDLTDPQPLEVTVKPGENATLPCRGREGADISLLKWTRNQSHVLFCRVNSGCVESYQDPVYRGRAQAVDPKMEHGEASMVLRNVTFEDAGRFECEVLEATEGRGKRDTTIRSLIDLKVDKDHVGPEPPKDGRVGLIIGLVAAAAVFVVVVVVVAVAVVYVVRPRNQNNNGSAPI